MDLGLEDEVLEAPGDTDVQPLELDASFLAPLELEVTPEHVEAPLVPGYEPTRMGKSAPAARVLRPDFQHVACPYCRNPQPDPAPAFCESCGTRLRNPRKKVATAAEDSKRCGECGIANAPAASNCRNCGSRLAVEERR